MIMILILIPVMGPCPPDDQEPDQEHEKENLSVQRDRRDSRTGRKSFPRRNLQQGIGAA